MGAVVNRSAGLFLVALVSGCSNAPLPTVASIGVVNGYEIECEWVQPVHVHADATRSQITTGKTTIVIQDGKLSVGGKAYGEVKPKDKIHVSGGKVSVNGQDRSSEG